MLAGRTLADFQDHLSSVGQFLPLDPPSPAEATIGGIVAANAAGPSRHAHGTARDLVLGLRFVQADGRVIKAGGKVVKNVAGYDMCRLLIGSLGTLGVIVEACFRLTPLPKTQLTLAVAVPSAQEAYRLAGQAAGLSLRAVELLNAAAARDLDGLPTVSESGLVLLLATAGPPEGVQRTREGVAALDQPNRDRRRRGSLWQALGQLSQPPAGGIATKTSALPSRAPELIERTRDHRPRSIPPAAHRLPPDGGHRLQRLAARRRSRRRPAAGDIPASGGHVAGGYDGCGSRAHRPQGADGCLGPAGRRLSPHAQPEGAIRPPGHPQPRPLPGKALRP